MREIKTFVNVPWLSGVENKRIHNTQTSFGLVPLVFRATRFRCNTLSGVPVYVYDANDNLIEEGYKFEQDLPLTGGEESLLWKSEASILLAGFAPMLKLKNAFEKSKGLQWLNPFTVRFINEGSELRIWQEVNGLRFPKFGYWTLDDFVFMRAFDPILDVGPGVSAADVALKAAQASDGTNSFLAGFLGSDALPITLITAKSMGAGEAGRLENWFKERLSRLKRTLAERVLGVAGEGIKVSTLTPELQTLDFPSLDDHIVSEIAYAFDIPKSILTADETGYTNGQRMSYKSYLNDTIIPRTLFYERHLNKYLAEYADGQYIKFAPEELPEMQENEAERSGALSNLVNAGMPLLAALDTLGYEISDESMLLIEKSIEEKQQRAEMITATFPAQPAEETVTKAIQELKIQREIENWLKKAEKSLKNGKSPAVEFDSRIIPDETKTKISSILEDTDFFASMKIGARHSMSDVKRIQTIHDMASEIAGGCTAMKSSYSTMLRDIHDHAVKLGATCLL